MLLIHFFNLCIIIVQFIIVELIVTQYCILDNIRVNVSPLVNGDFETGDLSGWTGVNGEGDPDGSVVTTTPHSGTYCYRVEF